MGTCMHVCRYLHSDIVEHGLEGGLVGVVGSHHEEGEVNIIHQLIPIRMMTPSCALKNSRCDQVQDCTNESLTKESKAGFTNTHSMTDCMIRNVTALAS